MDDFIFPGRAKPGSGAVERRNLPSLRAGYLSPEDAKAYAYELLRSAREGPEAYTAEGSRKPLGALSKDPRGDDAYIAGRRKGLSGMQKNLEDVKTELDLMQSKVSNDDGLAALKDIVSSIQSLQEGLSLKEYQSFYEDPFRNHPQLNGQDMPWNNPTREQPVSLRKALDIWRE